MEVGGGGGGGGGGARERSYLARVAVGEVAFEAVLVHNPLGFLASGCSSLVKN